MLKFLKVHWNSGLTIATALMLMLLLVPASSTTLSAYGVRWMGPINVSGNSTIDGDLNMSSNPILNVGVAGTDFGSDGSLTLAQQLVVSAGGVNVTGDSTFAGAIARGGWCTASGDYSHAEGLESTSSGNYSHAEGAATVASGMASHSMGRYSEARDYAQFAAASGRFSTSGDAQSSIHVPYESYVHNDSNWKILYLVGGNQEEIHIITDTVVLVDILLVGTTAGCAETMTYHIQGVIENANGTTAVLTQTVMTLYENDADFDAQIAANDTNDTLEVQVRDTTSGGATVRWVARVETVEANHP